MKKRQLIAIFLSTFASFIILVGCQKPKNNDNSKEIIAIYQNEVLPKIDCITKIKKLLDCTNIYFFDCDFSEYQDAIITDVSYNISINGYIIKNKSNIQVLDLNEEADIKFITNYKIITKNNCFGFSIISNVMESKTHRTNSKSETITKTPNQIYDNFTYNSIDDIIIDQITTFYYENNSITNPIKVPQNFYPCNLIPDAASQVKAFVGRSMYERPVMIITHYENEENKPNNETLIQSITSYFKQNGNYIKH